MNLLSIGIRRYRPEDAASVFEAARESTAEVYPWLPWCRPGYTREESEGWIAQSTQAWEEQRAFEFAIFEPETERYLGGVGINQINTLHRYANLGYWVRTGAAGRGIATEATKMAARFAIYNLGLQRVEILAATNNLRSLRVAEKAGAHREGVLRNRLLLHGQPTDAVLFSLIPADLVQEAIAEADENDD